MKKRLIALLSLTLLVLSACAPHDPVVPTPSSDPSPTPVSTPTPTPEPSVPPTPDPTPTLPPITNPPDESLLTAGYAFVYDCEKEQLLYYLGDRDDRIIPASLTKLFTCHVALQHLDEDTVVTAGEEVTWLEENASVAAVFVDYRLTVDMLVEGIMLQSGNDAALALSVAAGRAIAQDPQLEAQRALDIFMAEMNAQAQKCGLTNTYFLYPDGRDAEGHYSSPADLLTIAKLALDNPVVMRHAKVYRHYVFYESGQDYVWLNTNALVNPDSEYYCPDAIGLKTGTTPLAGNSLISAFERDGRTLLIGVFGCPEKAARFSETLYLYEHYSK